MTASNETIKAPVTTPYDVESVLGYSVGGDVGVACRNKRVIGHNADGTFVLSDGNINKWAKYKPVKYSEIYHKDERWWRGDDYKCGLNFEFTASPYSAYALYQSRPNYTYVPPPEGYPYRLSDFNNYYHKAILPLITNIIKDKVEIKEYYPGQDNFIRISISTSNSPNSLQLKDIVLDPLYLSIDVLDDYGQIIEKVISENEMTNYGGYFDYKIPSDRTGGLLNIVYYLFDKSNGRVFTIPYSNENYYMRKVRIIRRDRSIRARFFRPNYLYPWTDLENTAASMKTGTSAYLKISVTKIPTSITFNNTTTFFKTIVYEGGTMDTFESIGKLSSETGTNIPSSVTIPAGESGFEYVIYGFGGFYPKAVAGVPNGTYAELFVTYNAGAEWNSVGTFPVVS